MNLTHCCAILQEFSKSIKEWENSFIILEKESVNILQFKSVISESLIGFSEHLNISVLSGEYIDVESFTAGINNIETVLVEILSVIDGGSDNEEVLQTTLMSDLVNPIRRQLGYVKDLGQIVNNRFSNKPFKHLSPFKFDEMSDSLEKLLFVNVQIAAIDIRFSLNESHLDELAKFKFVLDDIHEEIDYKVTIKNKCEFLIYKLLFRIKQDKKYSYLYTINYGDKVLKMSSLISGIFKPFQDVTDSHYSEKSFFNSEVQLSNILASIASASPVSYKDIHAVIKSSKDHSQLLVSIKTIVQYFDSKFDKDINEVSSSFDKYALCTLKNYVHNNEFSLLVEQDNISHKEVLSKLKDIEHIQASTAIKNYFPYQKYVTYLDKQLGFLLNDKSNIDVVLASSLLSKMDDALKKAYMHLEWCQDNNYLAFQLPFNECKVDEVLIASSFVLPINFDSEKLKLSRFGDLVHRYETILAVYKSMAKQKKGIKKIRRNLEGYDKRSIEILGVFSAVVLFASGSIQIFSIKDLTIFDALTFMLAFSYSLVLFIFLVWLITREKLSKVSVIHKWFFFGLVVTTLIVLGYIFFGKPSPSISPVQNISFEKTVYKSNTISSDSNKILSSNSPSIVKSDSVNKLISVDSIKSISKESVVLDSSSLNLETTVVVKPGHAPK